jgi:uncharacterized protein DUF1488
LVTLIASNDTPLVKRGDVHFVMLDGTKRVDCVASREALEDAARITNAKDGELLDAFERFRMKIEAAAGRKYASGASRADGTVVVATADLNP